MTRETGEPRLTVLLATKGRHLYTLRFLWHADRLRMPYRFLVADGQVHEPLARLLEDPVRHFPNIDIEYVRYPDDADYATYYAKLADAAGRVRTPYVLQADNDDFPVVSGIGRCVSFLDANPDYVGLSGGVAGFVLADAPAAEPKLAGVVGAMGHVFFPYNRHYMPESFASKAVLERVTTDFRGSFGLYYSVFRADAFHLINREIAELKPDDLQLYETYLGARAKTLGKCAIECNNVSYIRQFGTSTSAVISNDWLNHLAGSRFSVSLDAFVGKLSQDISAADNSDAASVEAMLRTLYADKLRLMLYDQLVNRERRPGDPVRRLKDGLAYLGLSGLIDAYRAVRRLPYKSAILRGAAYHRARRRVVRGLARFGADPGYQQRFSAELGAVEQTLSGAELRRFAPLTDFIPDTAKGAAP